MTRLLPWVLVCLGLCLAGTRSDAASAAPRSQVDLLLDSAPAVPGGSVTAGLRFRIPPGWHIYWRNPGESGAAPSVQWTTPPGVTAGTIQWPVPEKHRVSDLTLYGYSGEVLLLVPLQVGAVLTSGSVKIEAALQWMECSTNQCFAQKTKLSQTIPLADTAAASADRAAFDLARTRLPSGPSPALALQAHWGDGAPTGGVRELKLSWHPESAGAAVDFYPYESKNWAITGDTAPETGLDGRVTLRRSLEKYEGEWPTRVAGLVVSRTAGTGEILAREAEFLIESALAAAPTAAAPAPATGVPADTAPPADTLWKMIVFAFLGGMILNVMPCVLPVISLKILGFVNQSAESPRRVRQMGLLYAAGVLVSFLALAGFVVALKQAGRAVSWGIQFGNPQFLVVLTTLVLLVALNLFGVFEVAFQPQAAGALAQKEGFAGAFFNGVLAVVLATPCTAPYLSLSIGFALAQPPPIVVLLFLTVGAGLAFPYVALAWQPAWLRLMPRPGVWMEHFKVAMGFPMLLTALWLYWLAGRHYGDASIWLGVFLVCTAGAAWIFGTFVQRGARRPALALALCAGLLAVGYGWGLESELGWRHPVKPAEGSLGAPAPAHAGAVAWKKWSPAAVAEARAQGHPVLVDFTADWCAICNVNRRTSIEIPSVIERLKAINAVAFLGDYTTTPDDITAELERWGRGGVPLVLVYPADPKRTARVLPEALTPGIVMEALNDAVR